MAIPRKSLKVPRARAFKSQCGLCYYCNQPMWRTTLDELTTRYPISAKQARLLQCTAEHLIPHAEGGSCKQENIVAACLFCNRRRHNQKVPLTPDAHRDRVQRRLSCGAWHGLRLVS